MLTQFKERLYNRISETLPQRNAYSVDVLTGPEIPADVGHFLVKALTRRARLEGRDLLPESSAWFDLESEPVRMAIAHFVDTLSGIAQYPAADFDRALGRAVDICTDYLIHPVATISAFAVNDQENDNAVSDVRRRASYFLQYGHVLESVDAFLNRHEGIQVERKALSDHLTQAETRRASALSATAWDQWLSPLVEANRFAYRDSKGLSVELISTFFREKKADKLADAATALGKRSGGMVSPDALHDMIRGVLEPKVVAPPPPVTPQRPASGGGRQAGRNDLPLWKQFTKEGQPTTSDVLSNPAKQPQAQPLWKTYRASETAQESIEQEVLGVDEEHRDRFVQDLFVGDDLQYMATLKLLFEARDWDTASSILSREVFRRNQIDIYSESAVLFTNAIERRVRQLS